MGKGIGNLLRSFLADDEGLNKRVLNLGIPIMFSSLSQTLMNTFDTIMVGRLGQEALGAAGLGNIFTISFLFPLGLMSMGARIKIARRYGAGEREGIGEALDNSLFLSLCIGTVLTFFIAVLSSPLMVWMNPDPSVGILAGAYVRVRILAAPSVMLIMCIQAFFEATNRTRITLYSTILITVSNVGFNAVLIFGLLGFPALGLVGAAWGSFLATLLGMLYLFFLVLNPLDRKAYNLFQRQNLSRTEKKSILRLSVPSMLEAFGGIVSYFIFVWIHSFIGTIALAAASVLNSVYGLMFLPAAGLGKATGIVVGQCLGQGDPNTAHRATVQAMKLGALFSISIAVAGLCFAEELLRLYTPDSEVVAKATGPLRIILVGTSVNSMGMVARYALVGAGMTAWVLKAQLVISYGMYLPVVLILGVLMDFGIMGTYMGEAFYFIAVFLVFFWKFRQGQWRGIQV